MYDLWVLYTAGLTDFSFTTMLLYNYSTQSHSNYNNIVLCGPIDLKHTQVKNTSCVIIAWEFWLISRGDNLASTTFFSQTQTHELRYRVKYLSSSQEVKHLMKVMLSLKCATKSTNWTIKEVRIRIEQLVSSGTMALKGWLNCNVLKWPGHWMEQ